MTKIKNNNTKSEKEQIVKCFRLMRNYKNYLQESKLLGKEFEENLSEDTKDWWTSHISDRPNH